MKTIQSLQADLQRFRDDILNERKEHQVINEALLRNMTKGVPQGKPTHPTDRLKKEPYHKRASSPRDEVKEEHTPKPPEEEYHSPSSEDSLSPCKKKQRSDDKLQGEFRKIRSPTYEGEVNTGEKAGERLLGMRKYF